MKKLVFLLALLAVALTVFAEPITWRTPDGPGEVKESSPLPSRSMPPVTAIQTVIALDATPTAVIALANRQHVELTATGTFLYCIGSTTIPVGTTPCNSASFDVGSAVPIGIVSNASTTSLTIRQTGF